MYPEEHCPTPNVTDGTNECVGVVLHHTGGSYAGALAWLTNPVSRASAHVIIAKDGLRAVLAPDEAITWHAGRSRWRERYGCNAFTLGVEFEGDTKEAPLTEDQIASWVEWFGCRYMKYGWLQEDVTDHRTVAVPAGRKRDLEPDQLARCIEALDWLYAPPV